MGLCILSGKKFEDTFKNFSGKKTLRATTSFQIFQNIWYKLENVSPKFLLESSEHCLFIGPGSRSWRRSEQVRPYGLCIFIIPYLWTRPKCITKGILSSCSSLQLLMDLLIAGKILLFFSQRLMDLLKLIMYIALSHSTAYLTSPYCENSKNRSCVQIANLI